MRKRLARATLVSALGIVCGWLWWPVLGIVAAGGTELARVRALVLGITQDGGMPHIGCQQELCAKTRADCRLRQRVACLGLIDDEVGRRFLIDATPDLPSQLASLNAGRYLEDRRRPVDGILLTHAHIGHYTGLMYLGREALAAKGVPVYATPSMAGFLRDNAPWNLLLSQGHIQLREMAPGRELVLTPDLRVTPFLVPHRDELSDTVGFRVRGPHKSLLYIPDIDKWERWDRQIEQEAATVDTVIVDGSFESAGEIPGRSMAEIPHPLVSETTVRLHGTKAQVLFTHLNHTNRLLWDAKARAALAQRGFLVAEDGAVLPL